MTLWKHPQIEKQLRTLPPTSASSFLMVSHTSHSRGALRLTLLSHFHSASPVKSLQIPLLGGNLNGWPMSIELQDKSSLLDN